MKAEDYDHHDALGLADLVRRGEVSAAEVCEAAIARIEALNPTLNAVVAQRFDRARSEARKIAPGQNKTFTGVPILLKDLIQQHADLPTTEGTRLLAHGPPTQTSELTSRMEAAGVIVLGKTNTAEFGLAPTTESQLFGPCRNPWNVERTTGGSSGGSAAAVASGMVPIAHGSDGGGSLRIPASCCGVFALKPSRGRNPPSPPPYDDALSSLLNVEHILTRSVRDSAAMLDATSGLLPGALFASLAPRNSSFLAALKQPPERLHCAILDAPLFNQILDPACRTAVRETAELLCRLGHTVDLVHRLPIDIDTLADAFLVIFLAECAHVIEAFQLRLGRRARTGEMEPVTWVLNRVGRRISAMELTTALAHVQDAQWAMQRFHEEQDILVSPVLAAPPLPLGHNVVTPIERVLIQLFHRMLTPPAIWMIRRRTRREAFAWTGYTQLANLTGLPAMSVPLHWTPDGLPIGTQMSSGFGNEALLLRLAAQLEEVAPWFHRRPPQSTEKQSKRPTHGDRGMKC